jgi:hypothetical protein
MRFKAFELKKVDPIYPLNILNEVVQKGYIFKENNTGNWYKVIFRYRSFVFAKEAFKL